MRRDYLTGVDILGAESEKILTIRVKNYLDLAKAEGALGTIAATLSPKTVESLVYAKMSGEFAKALKDKKVDADVQVIDGPVGSPQPSKFVHGMVTGGVAVGGGILIFNLIRKLLNGGK